MSNMLHRKWKGQCVLKHCEFLNGHKIYFDLWLKRLTCWSVISLIWCPVMAVHKCYSFCLKWKSILPPIPGVCSLLLAMSVFMALVICYSMVRSGTVTWHQWACGPKVTCTDFCSSFNPKHAIKVHAICIIYEKIQHCSCWFSDSAAPKSSRLTHWGRDKMANLFQTSFTNACFWIKMCALWLRFHWSLFQTVQLTTSQHWFR